MSLRYSGHYVDDAAGALTLVLATVASGAVISAPTLSSPQTVSLPVVSSGASVTAPVVADVGAFPTEWQRRCPVVIDASNVGTGGVSSFTVYLEREAFPSEACSPTNANRAQANGGDLRFTSDLAGTTRLPCVVDAFAHDSSDGAGDAEVRVHVLVASLSDSVDTTIYAWYHTATTKVQPLVTATSGGRQAWDTDHCHRYSLDEDPDGTAPQYRDAVSPRDATVGGTGSADVTGQHGLAFDGNGTGYAVAPFSGLVAPNNLSAVPCTNTGLCVVGDRLAVVNFDDATIVEIDKATGVARASFALSSGQPSLPQGLAWNSTASRYAVIGASASTLYLYQRDGTYDTSVAFTGQGNAVAYDATSNVYWVRVAAGQIRSIHTGTGATIATVTLSGDAASITVEGITHNATDDTLYLTADAGNLVYEVNKTTGATIQSFRGPLDIEHPAYDPSDDSLWVNGDARFHSGSELGENVIYHLTPDGAPWTWRAPSTAYTLEWWWKPDNVTTTAIALASWSAVAADGMYCEVQVRSSGVVRVYETDVSYVETAGGTLVVGTWAYWRLTYDAVLDTLTLYKNETQVAQATSAVFNGGPDGRLSIGGRPNGTSLHNGAIDEVRLHRSARSAAWWTTRYANTNAPTTFAAPGTPTDTSQTVALPSVSSGATVAAPTVVLAPLTLPLPVVASGAALYGPALTPGSVTVTTPPIASTEALYAPVLTLSGVTLGVPLLPSTEALYAPAVTGGTATLTLPAIASTAVLSAPRLYDPSLPTRAAEADTWRARARPTAWRARARPTAWKAKP